MKSRSSSEFHNLGKGEVGNQFKNLAFLVCFKLVLQFLDFVLAHDMIIGSLFGVGKIIESKKIKQRSTRFVGYPFFFHFTNLIVVQRARTLIYIKEVKLKIAIEMN